MELKATSNDEVVFTSLKPMSELKGNDPVLLYDSSFNPMIGIPFSSDKVFTISGILDASMFIGWQHVPKFKPDQSKRINYLLENSNNSVISASLKPMSEIDISVPVVFYDHEGNTITGIFFDEKHVLCNGELLCSKDFIGWSYPSLLNR